MIADRPRIGVPAGASDALLDRLEEANLQALRLGDPPAEIPDALDCVLVEPPMSAAIRAGRRVHAAVPPAQVIVVVPGPEERTRAEHSLLFASALGEVWVVTVEELDSELLHRAAEVARKRRGFSRLRERLSGELTALAPPEPRRIRSSDAYLAALLQVLADGVISVDADGRVLSWNLGAERLLGREGSEISGRHIDEVLRPSDTDRWHDALAAGAREMRKLEVEHPGAGGERRCAEVSIAPVEAAGEHVRVVVVHDITDQRRNQLELERQAQELESQASQLQEQAAELEMMNAELQDHADALEDALASRSRFYAAMSHELRTPMNAIIGYNSLLLDEVYGKLPKAQLGAVERANRAALHLLELVNDVLDLAKIEAGRIELEPEVTHLPEILHELSDTVRPLAEEQRSELVVDSPEGVARTIVTDPRRVRQVLLNLLSNALKFGDGKPVTLSWEPAEAGGVRISVIDHGRGIAREDQQRIFEEFVQLEREGGGTGLGLPISKRLADVLCGRLTVDSEPGRGSVFTLELPADLPFDGCPREDPLA